MGELLGKYWGRGAGRKEERWDIVKTSTVGPSNRLWGLKVPEWNWKRMYLGWLPVPGLDDFAHNETGVLSSKLQVPGGQELCSPCSFMPGGWFFSELQKQTLEYFYLSACRFVPVDQLVSTLPSPGAPIFCPFPGGWYIWMTSYGVCLPVFGSFYCPEDAYS